ncbi:hypothetical protein [Bacillus toyonensis]|uniref:hypothetical protein n=1 Tax=Bacillus toyonensis TaxID=155322 RepID=UPI002E2176DD|nr:hypothetical protein [Bacillus toyonensis]
MKNTTIKELGDFELYTIVYKYNDSITFLEAEYRGEFSGKDMQGAVRIYNKRTNICHKDFAKINVSEQGLWYVSQINKDGCHLGFEFKTAGELRRALPKLLSEAQVDDNGNPDEGYVIIYGPDSELVDLNKWQSEDRSEK